MPIINEEVKSVNEYIEQIPKEFILAAELFQWF